MKTRTKALSIAGGAILASSILAFQTFNRDAPRMTFETIPLDTAVFSEEDPLGAKALSRLVDITNAVETTVDETTGERTTSLNGNVTINGDPVASKGDVEGKQDKLPYPTNEIPYSVISGIPATEGITTNDVQAIVTNEVSVPRWTVVSMMGIETNFPIDITWRGESWSPQSFFIDDQDFVIMEPYPPAFTNKDATRLEYEWMYGSGPLVAQRTDVTYNALGLARLRDSQEITNAIMPEIKMRTTAPEVKKIVTSLVTNYSEWVIYSTNNVPIANPSDFGHSEIVWNDGWPRIMLSMGMEWDGEYFVDCEPQTPGSTDPKATNLVYMIDAYYSNHQKYNPIVFRRACVVTNVLGFARLEDLPSLTNALSNAKQDKLPYPTNAIPFGAIVDVPPSSEGGLSTNDVCNIVTNEVAEWSYSWNEPSIKYVIRHPWMEPAQVGPDEYEYRWHIIFHVEEEGVSADITDHAAETAMSPFTPEVLHFMQSRITATRLTRNSLGLARLEDLPPTISSLSSIPGAEAAATNAIRKIQTSESIYEIKAALVEFLESFKSPSPSN